MYRRVKWLPLLFLLTCHPKANSLLLPNGKKDVCYDEFFNKNAIECLQILLEGYYEKRMTWTCPDLADLLVEQKCTGCPWDRVDKDQLNEITAPLNSSARNVVFHEAEDTCRVAKHARLYSQDGRTVFKLVRFFGIFGALCLLVTSSMLSFNLGGDVQEMQIGKWVVPEWLFMLVTWIIFDVGFVMTVASEDYYLICENFASSLMLSLARFLGYAALLVATFQRVRRLEPKNNSDGDQQSWSKFVRDDGNSSSRQLIASIVYHGSAIALAVVFAADIDRRKSYRRCEAGAQDIKFGIFKYSMLVVEILALTVYSFGPSRRRSIFWIRYSVLLCTAVTSFVLFVFSIIKEIPEPSTLIPHVFDAEIAGMTNAFHALCISVFGLLEPLRTTAYYEN